mgnify:CR=1 FL=1
MAQENEISSEKRFHYDMLKNDEARVVDKLNLNLGFFSFRKSGKFKAVEVVYDTPDNLLASAGIVLSKQFEANKTYFKVRKISRVQSELSRKSQKFEIAKCTAKQSPKDLAIQVATAINNYFSNIFTIDLSDVVKNAIPKIEITIKGNLYDVIGGTGFKGTVLFEKVTYKDLISRKKVNRDGFTFSCPNNNSYQKEVDEILWGIERYCKELIPYNESRFEIAQRILHPASRGRIGIKNLRENKKEEE